MWVWILGLSFQIWPLRFWKLLFIVTNCIVRNWHTWCSLGFWFLQLTLWRCLTIMFPWYLYGFFTPGNYKTVKYYCLNISHVCWPYRLTLVFHGTITIFFHLMVFCSFGTLTLWWGWIYSGLSSVSHFNLFLWMNIYWPVMCHSYQLASTQFD